MRFPHARKLQPKNSPMVASGDEAFFEMLKDIRRQLASQKNVPPYVIAPNKTLTELARVRPTTKSAMMAIHGMGTVRFHSYGARFLEAIQNWRQD